MRARDYLLAMKGADPSIKVGLVAVTGEDSYANGYTNHTATNPRTGQRHNGWTPVMLATLKSLGITPDYIIFHRYAQNPGNESDAALIQSSRTWPNDAGDLRQQLTDYLGSNATNVELICTENNSVSSAPGKQTTSIVNALFYCDSLAQALQTEFRSLVWWDLRNGQDSANNNASTLYGWRTYGDYGVVSGQTTRYPVFYAAKLLKNFARGGDKLVRTLTDYPLLSAYACRRTNGVLSVLLLNKSSTNALTANILTINRTNHTNATLYSYGVAQDEAVRLGVGSPDVATSDLATGATNLLVSVPAYSALVISLFPPAPRLSLLSIPVPAGSIDFQVAGEVGSRYLIERATDLSPGIWTPFRTSILATPSTNFTDPFDAQHRFYRGRWIP